MTTRVYITVDTECREERVVGGRLQPAAGYDLRVFGEFANQPRPLGIPLLMELLEQHDLRGTFFVDPLGSASFGRAGLRATCQLLRHRGHDVQLHLHPRQRVARWWSEQLTPPPDRLADYGPAAQQALIEEGRELLVRCGVPAAEIVSLRAGHFAANNDTWTAMARAGMTLSSSFNPCYLDRGCEISWPKPEAEAFDTRHGVWELPISNFSQGGPGVRHLQITAVSLREMEHVLWQAHRLGIREVTIVTHSFELCHIDSVPQRRGRVNRVNLRRFRGLCRFLADNRRWFRVETVAQLAARLPLRRANYAWQLPRGRRHHRYWRCAEQLYKRTAAHLPPL